MLRSIEFKQANKWLFHIILVGAAIGSANYFRGAFGSNLFQAMVINTFTSLGIGYPLVLLIYNENHLLGKLKTKIARRGMLLICFSVIGLFGTELEMIVSSNLFNEANYSIFSAGSAYFLNIVIAVILGFSMSYWVGFIPEKEKETPSITNNNASKSLPIKTGKIVEFVDFERIVYLEAADNYAYVYDVEGAKKLCDHSLGYLEGKLGDNFRRVHRKYIINLIHVQSISHYNKGSHAIQLKHYTDLTIKSGETYLNTIKQITKL